MSRARWSLCGLFFVALCAHAQSSKQGWPEVDFYLRLNEATRLKFVTQLSNDRETGSRSGEVDASLEWMLKPFRKGGALERSLNRKQQRSRRLGFGVGYKYLWPFSGGSGIEHRLFADATPRQPLTCAGSTARSPGATAIA
jgi:hypothetical protein